ncbi:MAG: NUDIX hydrolase [Deltaproteobacteria bacterium]|nr:MAG: NUDIX hydrolase [Deltaproteobacteria bacterium]
MIKDWPLIKSSKGSDYSLFCVRIDTALSPRTGKAHDFYVIDTQDWVTVVPLTSASEVVMVRQFRHGIKGVTLETPGGLVDQDDDPLRCAQRELLEETGYKAREMELLGQLYPQPALFNNRFFVYLGRDAQKVAPQCQDEGEDLEVVLVPLQDIKEMISRGEIRHALVLAAFQLFFLHVEGRGSF